MRIFKWLFSGVHRSWTNGGRDSLQIGLLLSLIANGPFVYVYTGRTFFLVVLLFKIYAFYKFRSFWIPRGSFPVTNRSKVQTPEMAAWRRGHSHGLVGLYRAKDEDPEVVVDYDLGYYSAKGDHYA